MMRFFRILVMGLALCLAQSTMNAQSKAIGVDFSITGVGISYEHYAESGSFLTLDLYLDTDDLMWLRASHPGASASLIWNMVFAEKSSSLGNRISFFAGPGIMVGYVTDMNDIAGGAFGLKGRVGVECSFKRQVTLSASLSPILGCHITSQNAEIKMKLYKSGLLQTVIPEIGIKYTF